MTISDTYSKVLKPVIRRPRKQWCIPRIDASARLIAYQREAARIKAKFEGTTPEGREIMRKAFFTAQRMLEEGGYSDLEIIQQLQMNLFPFDDLKPQYAVILNNVFPRIPKEQWLNLSARFMANMIYFSCRIAHARETKCAPSYMIWCRQMVAHVRETKSTILSRRDPSPRRLGMQEEGDGKIRISGISASSQGHTGEAQMDADCLMAEVGN